MLVLPSERDAQRLSDLDERRRRELAHVRIGETDEEERAVTPAEARRRVEEHESARRLRARTVAGDRTPGASGQASVSSPRPDPQASPGGPARLEIAPAAVDEERDLTPVQSRAEEVTVPAEPEPRLCERCEKKLRRDNESGICSACRVANRKHRNGTAAKNGVARAMPPPDEVHGCDPKLLSDEDLAACILEARARLRGRDRLAELLGSGE
jgi:hypothetical protein